MKRILVVDDEESVCASLRKILDGNGYQVFTALNGIEAIRLLKEERPHVVLLDVRMPGPNGLSVLQRIKKIDPRTTVIMVTAVECGDAGAEALKLGADGYITKPIDPGYLQTVVHVKIAMMTV